MTHYQLTTTILSARIKKYNEDYVFLELKFGKKKALLNK